MLDEAGSKISEDNKHKLFMCVCDLFKNMNERDTRLDTSPPLTYMLVNIILKFCGEPEDIETLQRFAVSPSKKFRKKNSTTETRTKNR